jgi:hypothetical protein
MTQEIRAITTPTPNLDNFLAVYSEVMMSVAMRKEREKDALVTKENDRRVAAQPVA